MGVVRLGFVTTFLSDPLVSGFTTGVAALTLLSQVKHILGLKVPLMPGPFVPAKVTMEKIVLNFKSKNFNI